MAMANLHGEERVGRALDVVEPRRLALKRRLRQARFPYRKTLEQYPWSWPKKINPMEIQQLFRLGFLEDHTNGVFVGPVGLGKTHLAVALGSRPARRAMRCCSCPPWP